MSKLTELFQKAVFRFRHHGLGSWLRVLRYQCLGMEVGRLTCLCEGFHASWPQCVRIGSNCVIEPDVIFKVDSRWSLEKRIVVGNDVFIGTGAELNINRGIKIGDRCLIASGCKFVDHDHGFERPGPIVSQTGDAGSIEIGDDVWLGVNVVVLREVAIGNGSVVGAGAVVTRSIPSGEIWAGVPARKIGERPRNVE
ncbi:MAG: acyltransferase [Verrucomicrobiaceae bacterium]|nr:acyltransferase [Verrucomicrobiaceae bacterium]